MTPDTATPRPADEDTYRARLDANEYRILREAATEPAGTGRYLHEEGAGMYCCAACGRALYPSTTKFHSGCGWPSFFDEIEEGAITRHDDHSFGMRRTEMRCAGCGSHLGHIFRDGPREHGGNRHCVNGACLVFVPEGKDAREAVDAHWARQKN